MSKPKIIKHFNKLELELQTLIVSSFPRGFDKHLITFKGPKNKLISALPFETEEYSYFVKMTREEAIYSYTLGNAYAAFEEDFKGSIEIGKVADLTIMSQDLINCRNEEILEAEVLYTIINGVVKFEK